MLWSVIRHTLWVTLLLLVLSLLSFVILLRDPLNADLVTHNIYTSYFNYLSTLLHGDFGITYNGGKSLIDLILTVLPPTLELCFTALLLAFILGVPLGIISAVNSQHIFAKSLKSLSYVGLSIPIFWLAPILLYVAAVNHWEIASIGQYNLLYEIKPITGFPVIDVWFIDVSYRTKIVQNVLQHLALPTLVLCILPTMEIIRIIQQRAEYVLNQNFAKIATTRGWSKWKILHQYVFRNTFPLLVPQVPRVFTLHLKRKVGMQDKEPEEFRENTSIFQIWLLFRKNTVALFSFYLLTLLILTALFSGWIAPYAHNMQFVGQELMPPSWVEKGQIAFFFGTDDLGRDVLSRLIMGTSYTIGSSLLVVLAVALIGGTLGIVAGMLKGLKARFVGHIFDAFLSLPILLIAIVISTLMEPSLLNAMFATLLAILPYFIHAIYRAIQQELKKDYVLMLKLEGISNWELLKSTILPNITVIYVQEIARAFVVAILDISALSFISLGAQRPTPEWGAMIRDSLELLYLAPWTVLLPGFAIIFTILLSIIFSNGLTKAINQYYE